MYYIKLLLSETTKLLGSTESKKTKDKNGANVPNTRPFSQTGLATLNG